MVKIVLIFALFFFACCKARSIDTRHYYDVTTNSKQQLVVEEVYPVEYKIFLPEGVIEGTVFTEVSQTTKKPEAERRAKGAKTRCIGAVTTMALCF